MAELSANVRMIKGIGEQRAKALEKLGIVTLRDLIGWFPRRYEDRRSVKRIMDLIPGESACVAAMIASPPQLSHVRRGMTWSRSGLWMRAACWTSRSSIRLG